MYQRVRDEQRRSARKLKGAWEGRLRRARRGGINGWRPGRAGRQAGGQTEGRAEGVVRGRQAFPSLRSVDVLDDPRSQEGQPLRGRGGAVVVVVAGLRPCPALGRGGISADREKTGESAI